MEVGPPKEREDTGGEHIVDGGRQASSDQSDVAFFAHQVLERRRQLSELMTLSVMDLVNGHRQSCVLSGE